MSEKYNFHESYGIVQINKTSGGSPLFGSSVIHQHFFTLTVKRGFRVTDTTGERFRTEPGPALISLRLSAAQFLEMITNQNMGVGVPCTLVRVDGKLLEDPPQDVAGEVDAILENTQERSRELHGILAKDLKEIYGILGKKSVGVRDRKRVKELIGMAFKAVTDEIPFAVEMVAEATEKMKTKAKMEMESYLALGLQRLGLRTLTEHQHKQLEGSTDDASS